jgi:hypothetical protein
MVTLRERFLDLDWDAQKKYDFRQVFDKPLDGPSVDLTANCIRHKDDSASLVIYSNGVYCFGCKARWWPDEFLREIGPRGLDYSRGPRKLPAPKYIPIALVQTYASWLLDSHYQGQLPWLLARGLTATTVIQNLIGHTGEAFSIPLMENGIVRSIRYRRDDELAGEDRPKYWGTPGANQSMLYRPVLPKQYGYDNSKYGPILCEGELDALRLAQEGYQAVSLTNGCNAIKLEHAAQLRALARSIGTNRITVCYDQDEPGRTGSQAAVSLLSASMTAYAVHWPLQQGKDVTEYLSNTGPVAFENRLKSAWY